jgi:hypothetical protein
LSKVQTRRVGVFVLRTSLVLAAAGGATLSCPAIPGIGVTAELDSGGTVARIIVDQVGIFVPEPS